jgi:hypothetical protein
MFLGHIINRDGLIMDPKNVADIMNWKALIDVRGIKSFIGMAGYYRRFIEGFLKIARPIATEPPKVLGPPTDVLTSCHGTSQDIRPTYRCPCPKDLGQPCRYA